MNKNELLKDLRSMTQAGMKDCKDALEESNWDLDKAVDIVKAKGLVNTTRSSSKIAAEGKLALYVDSKSSTLVEINAQTDFVANSAEFNAFAANVVAALGSSDLSSFTGDLSVFRFSDSEVPSNEVNNLPTLEDERKQLMAITRENIVVRRWFRMDCDHVNTIICNYVHNNSKIGTLVSLSTDAEVLAKNFKEIASFGQDLAMQICAMNPLAVSKEYLSDEDVDRQKAIFEAQLVELNKPQAAWAKILEGKFNKWYTEVCLLDQESITTPKSSVGQLLENLSKKCGGEIRVLNFVRAVVGEGLETKQDNLAEEVAKMM